MMKMIVVMWPCQSQEPYSGKGGQDDALQETGRELDEICEACTTCLAIVDAVITLGSSEGKVRTTREEACIDLLLAPLKTLASLSPSGMSSNSTIGAKFEAIKVSERQKERIETLSEVATALAVTILTRHMSSVSHSPVVTSATSSASAPADGIEDANTTPNCLDLSRQWYLR